MQNFRILLFVSMCPLAAQNLMIRGDVGHPVTLNASDLSRLPRETIEFEEPGHEKGTYEGVSVHDLLLKAGIASGKELRGKALATYILATGQDGYQVVYALAELDPDLTAARVIVADKRDGKNLSEEQGPFRMICGTDKRAARGVRKLVSLEVVRVAK
jgi:hypothetical protein